MCLTRKEVNSHTLPQINNQPFWPKGIPIDSQYLYLSNDI